MAHHPWRKNSAAGSRRSLYMIISSAVKTVLFLIRKYITDFNKRRKRISSAGSCPSAAIVSSSEDLVTEILLLLPVKSVLRFKAVSKQWSLLISNERFTRLHGQCLHRSVETRHSFIMQSVVRGRARARAHQFFICDPCTVDSLVRVSIPSSIQQQPVVKILQSWNGLLLLSLGEDRIDYAVLNPTTERYRFIHLDRPPFALCLVSEPSKSEYYKILMITSKIPYIYSVYDSNTQEWSDDMDLKKDGAPFTGDALGFRMSPELSRIIMLSFWREGIDLYPSKILGSFPNRRVYVSDVFASNEYLNLVQLKLLEGNKLSLRVGRYLSSMGKWFAEGWVIWNRATIDLDSINIGGRGSLLGMMREKGRGIKDAVFLFHVPGRLLTYRMSGNQGLKVLLSRKREGLKVLLDMDDHKLQFGHAHPFIHTFAPV